MKRSSRPAWIVMSIPGRDHVSTLTARAFKDAVIAFLA